jgi:hypothetical protein
MPRLQAAAPGTPSAAVHTHGSALSGSLLDQCRGLLGSAGHGGVQCLGNCGGLSLVIAQGPRGLRGQQVAVRWHLVLGKCAALSTQAHSVLQQV